jgi:hypothetical protein
VGRIIHSVFNTASYLFLAALLLTVVAVVLVIVVPTLQGRDILEGGLYDMIESFMVRMLPYIIIFAVGYVVSSWGRYLSESPGPKTEDPSPPDSRPATDAASVDGEGERASGRTFRPEAVPPTHP